MYAVNISFKVGHLSKASNQTWTRCWIRRVIIDSLIYTENHLMGVMLNKQLLQKYTSGDPEVLERWGREQSGDGRGPRVSRFCFCKGGRSVLYHRILSSTLRPVAMFSFWILRTATRTQFSPRAAAVLSTFTGISTIWTLSTPSSAITFFIWGDSASVWTLPAVWSRVIIAIKYR